MLFRLLKMILRVKTVIVLIVVFLLIIGVVYGRSTESIDRRTVAQFELERFLGEWYEIARYDHPFERGLSEVKASYRLMSPGRIEVLNSGLHDRTGERRTARGRAKSGSRTGQLRVSFFLFFYSDYNVMELAPDYSWAVVGSRSSKYLWILSREPQLPAPTLNSILRNITRRGYRTSRLIFVDQQQAIERHHRAERKRARARFEAEELRREVAAESSGRVEIAEAVDVSEVIRSRGGSSARE